MTIMRVSNVRRANNTKNPEEYRPRLINEYLNKDQVIPEPSEFQKLKELHQRFHLLRFDDNDARDWSGGTADENMNRY